MFLYFCKKVTLLTMKYNFLQNLYKGKYASDGVDWDFINTIPEMARLHECEQNPV